MATVLITNLTAVPQYISDLYTSVPATSPNTLEVSRALTDIPRMAGLMQAKADGLVSVVVTLTDDEINSGLASTPNSITSDDIQAIAAAAPVGVAQTIKKSFAAGGGGAPDDVIVYAANALPYKFRIVDAYAFISAGNAGGRTLTIRDEAAGAGTSAGTVDCTNLGRVQYAPTSNASAVFTPGATKGLFVRRSDSAIAGEIFITIVRES